MERKLPERNAAKVSRLLTAAKHGGALANALFNCGRTPNAQHYVQPVIDALTTLYGKHPVTLDSVDEFWSPTLAQVVTQMAGEDLAAEMPAILRLRLEGPFSSSPERRSYHSAHFGHYARSVTGLLCGLIVDSSYEGSVEELLYCDNDRINGYEYRLALAIVRNDPTAVSLVREAILGDNTKVLLSRCIIRAVIISGNDSLVDDLLKLLKTARLQEGVRQQILENADVGSTKTFARILKVCIDEELFRFSSTIRAFDTWTGMGYSNEKPANILQCAAYAYACLTDTTTLTAYLNSDNVQQAYFALWAMGCSEFADTLTVTQRLLSHEKKHLRLLGWLFISRMDNIVYQMRLATQHLDERDEEVLAWLLSCLPIFSTYMSIYHRAGEVKESRAINNPLFPADKAERYDLFAQLKEVALFIGHTDRTFTGKPFEFTQVTLNNRPVIRCLMSIAGLDMDMVLIEQLLKLAVLLDADDRSTLIRQYLLPETMPQHRAYLRRALKDRSSQVKEYAAERLAACAMDVGDLEALADCLRSKSGAFRKKILELLLKQSDEDIRTVLPLLLTAKEEPKNLGAIELLLALQKKKAALVEEHRYLLQQLRKRKLSTETQRLLDQLCPVAEAEPEYTKENGFGLYDPAVTAATAAAIKPMAATPRKADPLDRLFRKQKIGDGLLTAEQIRAMLPVWTELLPLFDRMNEVFERHADFEYVVTGWDGSKTTVLFGNANNRLSLPAEYGIRTLDDTGSRLEMVPFWEELLQAIGTYATDPVRLVGLRYITSHAHRWPPDPNELEPWILPYEALRLSYSCYAAGEARYGQRYQQMLAVLSKLHQRLDAHEVFTVAMHMYRSMIAILGEDNLGRFYTDQEIARRRNFYDHDPKRNAINHPTLSSARQIIQDLELSDQDHKVWFLQEYRWEKKADAWTKNGLTMQDHFRVYEHGVVPRDVLMEFLIASPDPIPKNIQVLSDPNRRREWLAAYPRADAVARDLTQRIAQVEEKRGEMPTLLTRHARAIKRLEGATHFCDLLVALGKNTFFHRDDCCQNTTKVAVLSYLLKHCYPAEEDTPQTLAALLRQTDISDKRLVEAAMYAPQWSGFVETLLGWKGLQCGVWFFHAHISASFSAEKEAEAARYSPLRPQQFNDGIFDRDWFFSAYKQLGEEHFETLYTAAKHIACGTGRHRRSQLYTDAARGKLDLEQLENEISEKRHQDKLRCYPLLPIAPGDKQEILRRYLFIQKFLKESRQFGAQRQESERNACAVAIENLAIASGIMDVNRLMWQMESMKADELHLYMKPTELEGISVRLTLDDNGNAAIAMEKQGKALKSVPKVLGKNDAFLTMRALVQDLKDLKNRSAKSLEQAMIASTPFAAEELAIICGNPVLAPTFRQLVWTDETHNGFLHMRKGHPVLVMLTGEEKPVKTSLRLAHPHDLRTAGEWAAYMRLLYERQCTQPFKQVFREYYPITEDERQERMLSRRYAGHQVQPQRAVALLRSRGWTVDYDEGLQKVYYKEGLVACLYAMADWFSPADIEAPTLETVRFYDRVTGELVALDEVPPPVFSETMRDIDLMVSVAHVGGVDPEASHSTVEMRVAIARELTALLGLTNVSLVGAHARIQGTLSHYSVHMGSGVVHAQEHGMIVILPVHSQARGHIFLPFADDDPKTAEIMSKVILLAEDQKLKDPSILEQLCT